ncbi:MAG TPA: hypothetical protein VK543_06670, partial [Puia sp.]|nr:hypothetical protein [Puia sp.]
WESSQGSGKPHLTRFPDFQKDLDEVRSRKMEIGVWETVGWISDTIPYGLGSSDLIVDQKGLPCKTNWNFDDAGESYYCLDISSPRVKAFLRNRTIATMQSMHPSLLKLDFGYALPSPNMGVPRDPANRGERYSFELIKIISDAAKTVDPNVIVMNYGISPLWFSVTDMISLDDQGDLWYELHRGHQEWSIWASLLGSSGIAVTGSSSYNWSDDAEVLLNSAIIGVPGASLALTLDEGKEIPESFINRRFALNKFCRRTILWKPGWFNSRKGDLNGPPKLNCWGREEIFNGKVVLSALALREEERESIKDSILLKASWSGDWCLIAQDNQDVMSSRRLAIIPFSPGKISIPFWKRPKKITRENVDGPLPFTDWTWKRGVLSLSIPAAIFAKTGAVVVEAEE